LSFSRLQQSATMQDHQNNKSFRVFIGLLFVIFSSLAATTDKAALTVRESGANLYAQQDIESAPIAKLPGGEELMPLAEAVAQETWYLVRTREGLVGWVHGAEVSVSAQLKETFKQQQASSWSARTVGGRVFEGTWTVDAAEADKATGTWSLRDGTGVITSHGTWSAQKFSTGWNGAWRAAVEGQAGELTGSWTADLRQARDGRFAELFESAARDIVRGIWNAGSNSGSWSIRAVK
jgi:hypothetical protein